MFVAGLYNKAATETPRDAVLKLIRAVAALVAATNPETPPATIMVVVDVVPPPWRLSRMPICPLGIGGGVGYVVEIADPYG